MAARSTRTKDARAGKMLAVEVGEELLAALRLEAKRLEQPLTTLVRRMLADGLEQRREGGQPDAGRLSTLEAELAALEARVAALEATPRSAPSPAPPSPGPQPVTDAPAGALTTAELAERSGTNRAAWNNWASGHAIGDVRHHAAAGSWRLVGKAPPPGGGPERWLWELV